MPPYKTIHLVLGHRDTTFLFKFNRIASRLAMIPFVAGPRSPNGLQAQLQAEEMAKVRLAEAPRALGALLSIDMSIILQRTNEIKLMIAEDCPDIDDRVLENYSLLLSMGEEVSDKCNVQFIFLFNYSKRG